jgi:hypothetical protein
VARWERPAWSAFLICAAVAYAPVVAKLASDWWNLSDYSDGLNCVPLAVGIAIARRRELSETRRAPHGAGFAGAVFSLMMLGVGTLGAELFLTRVTLPLQFAASATAATALRAFHVPVLCEGNVLVLANATLQVAEACSGVRSMMSLVVIGLIVARYLLSALLLTACARAVAAVRPREPLPSKNDTLDWIYVQRHEHEQALPFLSAAATRAPGNPIYHYHLGVAYRQTGDRARAREELQRAMASKQPFHDRERAAQALAGL